MAGRARKPAKTGPVDATPGSTDPVSGTYPTATPAGSGKGSRSRTGMHT